MLFNAPEFLLFFLPVVLLVSYALARLNHTRWVIMWMVTASVFFYGWFSFKLLLLLAVSILINFGLGRKLALDRRLCRSHPVWLWTGILANVSVLGYFKYTNFVIINANLIFGTHYVLQNILLPIGISFFAFQKIAYLVDAYRGEAEEYDFLSFCLFVMYFPQLIAGPIVHHKDIVPQFRNPGAFRYVPENFAAGIALFTTGLVKKVFIADNLAQIVNPVFAALAGGNPIEPELAWGGALGFTFQIYFDFSGYTDMALGLALMSGIRLPLNFNSPYKAANIIDFWRRWHMSLSRFIRNYVYIPLGGKRRGHIRRYLNLMLTMLVGGLWHGAAWTFVAWGGLHGFYLILNHGWQWLGGNSSTQPAVSTSLSRWVGRLVTFLAVVIAWVFFRAESFSSAWLMLESMFGIHSGGSALVGLNFVTWQGISLFVLLLGWVFLAPNSQQILAFARPAIQPIEQARLPHAIRRMTNILSVTSADGNLSLGTVAGVFVGFILLGVVTYQAFRSTVLHQFIYFQF
jgi:alginate O-acetyltransferase complex protein AlgI